MTRPWIERITGLKPHTIWAGPAKGKQVHLASTAELKAQAAFCRHRSEPEFKRLNETAYRAVELELNWRGQ